MTQYKIIGIIFNSIQEAPTQWQAELKHIKAYWDIPLIIKLRY